VEKFNGRDQVIADIQYAGSTTGTHQDTLMTYDGHGRVSTVHKPEWFDSSNNLTYTTTTYNADDTVATVTDPRGAVMTYTYENASGTLKRPLVSTLGYTVPTGSGIHDPADVIFAYDSVGNRTSMQDETGTLTYSYDALSRLTSETKDFADNLTTTPGGSGVYTLSYTYNLNNSIKTITEPYGEVVKYSADKTSRLTAIGDSSVASALGVDITKFKGDSQLSSASINKKLKEMGCK
jgi:YD repeat-containing protein